MRYFVISLIILAPLALAGYLVVQWTAPSGVRVVSYEPGHDSAYVQRPLPDDRVTAVQSDSRGSFIALTDEPVYFSVQPPLGSFDTAKVTVEFDPQDTPILELGGLTNVASQAFDFQPLANLPLADLIWTRATLDNGKILLSPITAKVKAEDFFKTPPPRSEVATYRATYPIAYRDTSYVPCSPQGAQVCHSWNVALRGSQEALTYIKDEQFSLDVQYVDLNRTYGADEGFVQVFNEQGDVMKTVSFKDDGNVSTNQIQSTPKVLSIQESGWPEGVYRIVFSGTSDIAWRSFVTHQKYFVFKNGLYIADDVGFFAQPRATAFFTNAKHLVFETAHAEGLQTVTVGKDMIDVSEAHEQYALTLHESGLLPGASPVGDIKITGEGKFALSADAFFDPDPAPINAFTDYATLSAEYIYATLPEVASRDGWRVATATFPISELAQEADAYKFAISAPGLETFGTSPQIHRITVRFEGPPPTLHDMAANLWHRIKSFGQHAL